MVPSVAVLVVALVGIARHAAPQQVQRTAPDRERAQAEPNAGGSGTSINDLRKRGLDIVLVIDGTGSMSLIINDLKAKIGQLVYSVRRLVPIGRIGIIVFGNKGEMSFQPLTLSPQKLSVFLNTVQPMGGANVEEDTSAPARKRWKGWTGSHTPRRWWC